jgi:hypothetical protein
MLNAMKIIWTLVLLILLNTAGYAQTKKNIPTKTNPKVLKEGVIIEPKTNSIADSNAIITPEIKEKKSELKLVNDKPKRIEISAENVDEDFTVLPMGSLGVLNFYKTDEKGTNYNAVWEFIIYDQNLKKEWQGKYTINHRMHLINYRTDEKNQVFYMLMQQNKSAGNYRYTKNNLTLIRFDGKSKKFDTYEIENNKAFSFKDFQIIDNKVYVAGANVWSKPKALSRTLITAFGFAIPAVFGSLDMKTQAVTLMLDMNSKKTKAVNLPKKIRNTVLNVDETSQGDASLIYIETASRRDKLNMSIQLLNDDGTIKRTIKTEVGEGKQASEGHLTTLNNNESFVTGSYSLLKQSSALLPIGDVIETKLMKSTGLFISKLNASFEQEFVKIIPFSNFKNINIANNNQNGISLTRRNEQQNTLAVKTRNVIKRSENEYVLMAEAYSGVYQEYYVYDPMTRTTSVRYVLVGYSFDVAMLLAFDNKGEVLWSDAFPIKSPTSWNMSQKTQLMKGEGNDVLFVYSDGENLKYKTLHNSSLEDNSKVVPIATGLAGDDIKRSGDGNTFYWYDDYFLTYSYQDIKNTEEDKKNRRRKVYALNKIAFR